MRALLHFLVLGLAFALANSSYVHDTSASVPASDDYISKQSKVFALFDHVYLKVRHYDWYKIGSEYNIEANIAQYNKPKLIHNFLSIYENGMLIRKQPFSIFINEHFVQAKALFELFYNAKNFDTFYKSAAFARINVNEGMFMYALTVALLHRPDTKGLILPAPYEVNPYYFANEEVVAKIQGINSYSNFHTEATKQVAELLGIDYDDALKSYIVYANYSGAYSFSNEEDKLSYYTEDVGLNSYYAYFQADYPFWLGGEEYGLKNDRRGELYYYFHQQMLARYYLERRTNGLGDIPTFSWYKPMKTGYDCNLRYFFGYSFPSRPNYYDLKNIPSIQNKLNYVTDYESYLSNMIDAGFYKTKDAHFYNLTEPESIEFLGNFIQHNPDFNKKVDPYHSYEYNARFLLGGGRIPYESNYAIPSALEQFETTVRDPIFYQFYKKLIGYFFKFKSALAPYTASALKFTGVEVISVDVDKLVTYFDYFDYDGTRAAVYGSDIVAKLPHWFKIRQPRLTHKPFNVKVKITSGSAVKSVIKFFVGPKYDSHMNVYNLDENKYNFVELDNFVYELQSGENVIERNCAQFSQYSKDQTMFYKLFQKVIKGEKIPLDMSESHNGFPYRLMLPKGTKAGFPLVLYVIVYPYEAPHVAYGTGFDPIYQAGVGSGARFYDNKALGFPLDRPIDKSVFHQTNMYFKDVNVYQYDNENVFVYSQIYYYRKFNKIL